MSDIKKTGQAPSVSDISNTPQESILNKQGDSIDINHIYVDPIVEKRALSKFDKFIMPQMAILVLIAYLDRSNIGNARVFGFEDSLGLVGNDFNNISTLFYVTYVVFEVPWVMAVKRWGGNGVMAIAMVGWSATTLATGFVRNYHQTITLRLVLGIFEAGLFPCLTFIISTIYSREKQAKRIAVLYGAIALSGAFGGLIAYAIQTMGERRGLEAWRWLFILEGAISLVVGGLVWFTLPSTSENAWFLKEDEKEVMHSCLRRDALYKGNNPFSWSFVKLALTDPFVYLASICLFCSSIPLFGFSTFLPTIIKGMGFSSLAANYLTIPVYIFACFSLALMSWLSDMLNKRALCAILVPIPVLIGYAIVIGTSNNAAGFFAMFLCGAGIYPYNTLLLTWVTNNLTPDYKRSIGMPLVISLANVSGLISSQIYPSSDAPRYITGNSVSLATEAVACLGIAGIYMVLRRRNAKKAALVAQGATTNGLEGDRALDFVYTL